MLSLYSLPRSPSSSESSWFLLLLCSSLRSISTGVPIGLDRIFRSRFFGICLLVGSRLLAFRRRSSRRLGGLRCSSFRFFVRRGSCRCLGRIRSGILFLLLWCFIFLRLFVADFVVFYGLIECCFALESELECFFTLNFEAFFYFEQLLAIFDPN